MRRSTPIIAAGDSDGAHGVDPYDYLVDVLQRVIDPAKFIHETVGCAMRTDWLNGAHGAPYDPAGNLG